jgi:CHAT domain-containing protein
LWLQRNQPYETPNDLYLGMAPSYPEAAPVAVNEFRSRALESVFPGYFRQVGSSLRYNVNEIEAAKKYFNEHRVFLGAQAGEDTFKTWAPRARYIHLAAHGFANTTHPSYSHLALVPGVSSEDGLVFTDEIYNMSLQADLVVLSACGTGDGKYQRGSGVQSLARAFRAAGSREVLMSLWPIEDLTTYELITDFFRVLPKSNTATALQRSIRDHLATVKQEALTHPYYWAGFSVQGTDPLPGSGTSWRREVVWALSGVLLLLLGWYGRRRVSK